MKDRDRGRGDVLNVGLLEHPFSKVCHYVRIQRGV